jgi:methionyl-tRNA formyltransferase
MSSKIVNQKTDLNPGSIVEIDKKHLYIAAAQSTVLSIEILKPAGKKEMKIDQFLNGAISRLNKGQQYVRV